MVSLLTLDGVIIVRFPLIPEQIGQSMSHSKTIKSLQEDLRRGCSRTLAFLDEEHNIPRFYTFRKISDLPIVAIIARDTDNILKGWRERVRIASFHRC